MTARVYHLFARYRGVKFFMIVSFVLCIATSSVYQGFGMHELEQYADANPLDPDIAGHLGNLSCFAEMRLPPDWGFWSKCHIL